jgi:hypothetical protein
MASFLLFLAVLSGGVWIVTYLASNAEGTGWAISVCSMAQGLCDKPSIALWTAVALAGLWVAAKFAAVIRD